MANIHIYKSNALEKLADKLAQRLLEIKRKNFSLKPDIILVNNYEMAQWLSIRLAEGAGICANVEFRLVGSWIWELSGQINNNLLTDFADDETIDRYRLRWLILSILQEIYHGQDNEECEGLKKILEPVRHLGQLGLYEFSVELSQVFDRYMNYAYQLLDNWLKNDVKGLSDNEKWQGELWRLMHQRAGEKFKLTRLMALMEAICNGSVPSLEFQDEDSDFLNLDNIPEVIHLFGISYLPPLHMEIINALSSLSQIEFYYLVPCNKYWADITTEKDRIKLQQHIDPKTVDDFYPVGNELLASLGNEGRKFQKALYDLEPASEKDLWHEPGTKSVLSVLQHSILHLRNFSDALEDSPIDIDNIMDCSIEFHSCHSRIREIEVVHDRLVDAFLKDPTLSPKDVAVIAPNISDYHQAIEAVFGSAPEERYIPYSIGDLGIDKSSESVSAFLALLDAATGDFTAPELMDLISHPVISSRYGLGSEALNAIHHWIGRSGIRRGLVTLSEASKCTTNTWLFGLDRLMITGLSATKEPVGICDNTFILPLNYAIEGEGIDYLASVSSFVFDLSILRKRLKDSGKSGRDPDEWLEILLWAINRFLSKETEADPDVSENLIGPLVEFFNSMKDAGLTEITSEVLIHALKDFFSLGNPQRAFFTGKVLFSSLVPLRTLPFRIICLIGMNQEDFPRNVFEPSYDLTAKNRAGAFEARNRRDEDRYLFLETIMSARQRLIITFIGRRQSDNEKLVPSTVVSEILETLAKGAKKDTDAFIIQHPLQPFGQAYFKSEDPRLKTFAFEWLPFDTNGSPLDVRKIKPVASWPCDFRDFIDPKHMTSERLDLGEILAVLGNPVRHFLRNILSINVNVVAEALEECETYIPKYFQEKGVIRHILDAFVSGKSLDLHFFNEIFHLLVLEGIFPNTRLSYLIWQFMVEDRFLPFSEVLSGINIYSSNERINCSLNISEGTILVSGKTGFVSEEKGLLEFVPNIRENGKILFWTKHLLWCLTNADVKVSHGCIYTTKKPKGKKKKEDVRFEGVPYNHAFKFVAPILELVSMAKFGLVPFWPKSSYAFAKELQGKPLKKHFNDWAPIEPNDIQDKDIEMVMEAVIKFIENDRKYGSGYVDPWLTYLCRGKDMLLDELLNDKRFWETSISICAPMFWAMSKGR